MSAPEEVQVYTAIRMEIDVTPRWWRVPSPAFFEDASDCLRVLGTCGVPLILLDVSIGATGIRIVTGTPAGASTEAVEMTRRAAKDALDDLDRHHPRRQAQARANEAAAAPPKASEPTPAEPPPAEPPSDAAPTEPLTHAA